jgi:iron complex outermembrane receptor protein
MPSVSLRYARAWVTAFTLVLLTVGICDAQEDPAAEDLPAAGEPAKAGDDLDKLMNMDLDQLVNVEVSGIAPATLGDYPTETEAELPPGLVVPPVDRRTPASVTRIDYDQIWASGARDLNELFDIYVPNVEIIRHNYSQNHVIIRGLLSDAEDKYLLLVNGKVMNQRTFEGATSERDLPMLGDIHHIDFIRGPGAAVYGPGAIAGVISITTFNGITRPGTDVTVKQGAFYEFTDLEFRHGEKLDDDTGLFLYYGGADIQGADLDDAPLVFGSSFDTPNQYPNVEAGEPVRGLPIPDDHAAYRGLVKHKAHLQFNRGNFEAWLRYTRGGEQAAPERKNLATPPVGFFDPNFPYPANREVQFGYQQLTAFMQYDWEWSEEFNWEFRLSYDTFDFERGAGNSLWQHHREDEYYGRALASWTPVEEHSLSFGTEMSREIFGLNSPGWPHARANTSYVGVGDPWYTSLFSLLAEYRWEPSDDWTFFLGGREDIHTYTDWLFSPRGVIIYTPDEVNTYKFIASQAMRKLPDGLLRAEFLNNNDVPDPESIRSLEARWERQPTESFWTAFTGFIYDSEFVGYVPIRDDQEVIADVVTWGLEWEVAYTTECDRFSASQAYTTLASFDLIDPTIQQGFSSMPYGFGHELANWSPLSTKLQWQRRHNECMRSYFATIIYWGFPGSESYAHYNQATAPSNPDPTQQLPYAEPGYTKAFGPAFFVDYGFEYKLTDWSTVNLNLYNVLGWFDERLNKRNYILGEQNANYRSDAASIGVAFNARM